MEEFADGIDTWKFNIENIAMLRAEVAELQARIAALEVTLEGFVNWSNAYPLSVFPEPDFKKVRELLEAGGITLDAVSASNMRYVVEGVGKIAKETLYPPPPEK